MSGHITTGKDYYSKFESAAKKFGLTESEIKMVRGSVFEVAYILKLKEDEVKGIFISLEEMATKQHNEKE